MQKFLVRLLIITLAFELCFPAPLQTVILNRIRLNNLEKRKKSTANNKIIAGSIQGAFAVNNFDGSAGYEIPIAIPPGTAGVQPSLSLAFSSNRDNNLEGVSFKLDGLSSIYRCPPTLAQDGRVGGIKYSPSDRLCIDGKRLVLYQNGTYGGNGTEYRTELESFSRIISHGTQGSGPAWFEVWTKEGQYLRYGNTSNSRILAQGKNEVRVWAIDLMSDRFGNYMQYAYTQNSATGEYAIQSVDYTGNEQQKLKPYNTVQFHYETRPDPSSIFVGGSMVQTTLRMTNIQSYLDSTLVFQYNITYMQACEDGQSRITSIQQCAGDGTCMNPTTFQWSETCNTPFLNSSSGVNNVISSSVSMASLDISRVMFGDFDGNGYPDVLIVNGYGGTPVPSTIWLNYGQNHVSPVSGPAFPIAGSLGMASNSLARIRLIDWNSDGKEDIYYINGTGSNTTDTVYLSNGNGSFNKINGPKTCIGSNEQAISVDLGRIRFGDFNGDGLPDIYYINSNSTGDIFLNVGSNGTYMWMAGVLTPIRPSVALAQVDLRRITMADFNIDGITDIYMITGWGTATPDIVYLSNGAGQFVSSYGPSTFVPGSVALAQIALSRVRFLDVNGDGGMDYYYINGTGFSPDTIFLNQGNGSFLTNSLPGLVTNVSTLSTDLASVDLNRINMGDFNNDGFGDVYIIQGSGNAPVIDDWYVGRGNGSFERWQGAATIVRSYSTEIAQLDLSRIKFIGWDGDEMIDIFMIQNGTDIVFHNENSLPQVTNITDGLGSSTLIQYAFLTNPSVYQKDNDAVFPVKDVQEPLPVVQMISSSNAVGTLTNTSYFYQGAKHQQQGYGFLGFRNVTIAQADTGIATWTNYSMDYTLRLQSRPLSSLQYSSNLKQNLVITNNTWNVMLLNNGGGTRYFPYVELVHVDKYDLNGAWMGLTVGTSMFDSLGNPTNISNVMTDPSGTYYSQVLTTYLNDQKQWIIGLPLNVTAQNMYPNQPILIKNTVFQYQNHTGAALQQTVEPGTNYTITNSFGYDSFGNRLNVTVSGHDIKTRVTVRSIYDSRGQFAIQSFNALNHTVQTSYDYRFGLPITKIDENNLKTTIQYDSFGRPVQQTNPDRTTVETFYPWCQQLANTSLACPQGSLYAMVINNTIGVPSATYFGSQSQQIRALSVGFNGTLIFVDNQYNNLNQLVSQSNPYYNLAGIPKYWSQFVYDDLGRVVETINVDNTASTVIYNGLNITSINSLNQKHTDISNSKGNKLLSSDFLQGSAISNIFEYDSSGNNIKITDAANNEIIMKYNILGFRNWYNDANRGNITTRFNVLGELLEQIDSIGNSIIYSYDLLGRKEIQESAEAASKWIYDPPNGIGKLGQQIQSDGFQETILYDNLSRPVNVTTMVPGSKTKYSIITTYDQYSRVNSTIYPITNITVINSYNQYGYLTQMKETESARPVQQINSMDASNRILQQTLGNGLITTQTYNYTGYLIGVQTGTSLNSSNVQNLRYGWDSLGNFLYRKDLLQNGLTENFIYDELNRVTSAVLSSGQSSGLFQYNNIGNIIYKSDVGHYGYGSKPNAVSNITNPYESILLKYDGNGNILNDGMRSYKYNSVNKPISISRVNEQYDFTVNSTFNYGPDEQRYQKIDSSTKSSGNTNTTIYIGGGLFEEIQIGGVTTLYRHYIGSSVLEITSSGSDYVAYMHNDQLGSLDAITNPAGAVVERHSYDAFGAPRNPCGWNSYPACYPLYSSSYTNYGFSQHEELYSVGLVYMGSRLYNAVIGRFLSADTILQYPSWSQGVNSYSYVGNNPLSRTDPTGHGFLSKTWKKIKHATHKVEKTVRHALQHSSVLRAVVGVVLYTAALSFGGPYLAAAVNSAFSAYMTKIQGGSWKQALSVGALSFGTQMIGLSKLSAFNRVLIAGTANGLYSLSQGGSFVSGFVAGAQLQGLAHNSLSAGAMTFQKLTQAVVGTAVQTWARSEVQSTLRGFLGKYGKYMDLFDAVLTGLSFIGGVRQIERMPSGAIREFGIFTRHLTSKGIDWASGTRWGEGASGFFDTVDILLTFQGLPSATEWTLLSQGYVVGAGHSEGASGALIMQSYGASTFRIQIDAPPILNPGGWNISPATTALDIVTGTAPLFLLQHPTGLDNIFADGGKWRHGYDFYSYCRTGGC